MNRRDFSQLCTKAAICYPLSAYNISKTEGLTRPKPLFQGAKIGLIAPGSPVSEEKLARALSNVADLEMVAVVGKHATKSLGYLAGTDSERLEDIHAMFADPEIDGIWCIRGGYGCTRLLPEINYELIRKNPKVFIGFSDVTALHSAIVKECRMVTFHGPVASSELTAYSQSNFQKVVFSGDPYVIESGPEVIDPNESAMEKYVIRPGKAEGPLTGGNLSLLAATAGTPYSPTYAGKIVCIEEVGENPYRIDRMLVQLLQATDLSEASGIVLGVFKDCEASEDSLSLSLKETLMRTFEAWTVPVYYGFTFGHIDEQCTLPMGVQCSFDTDGPKLTIEEPTLL